MDAPSSLWIVLDPKAGPEFAAAWREGAHEHIKDCLDGGTNEAARWVVREYVPIAEVERLRADVASLTAQLQSGESFHAVAVRQRDAAWKEIEALRDANERLNVAVAEAERIVRAYARRNPRHEYKGVIQDPFGAHGWLDRFDAARAAQGGEHGPG